MNTRISLQIKSDAAAGMRSGAAGACIRSSHHLARWVSTLAFTFALGASALAQGTLFQYDFTGKTGSETSDAASSVATGLTVSGISRGAGLVAGAAAGSIYSTSFAGTATTLDISNNDYYTFTLTPGTNQQLALNTLTFTDRRSGTGPTMFSIRSSVDNFASSIFSYTTTSSNSSDVSRSFDFSTKTGFSALTAPIELRIYGFAATNTTGSGGYRIGTSTTAATELLTFTGAVTTVGVAAGTPNYFDTNGSAGGIGINGGTAVFDTTTTNFTPTVDGIGSPKAFDNTQVGIFGGTSGAVTVGTVTATAGLRFASGGYVFNGGAITLATTPTIEVTTATDTATINSQLSGTAGLTKLGAGTLVLGSTTSDFTGTVAINGGTLSISSDANLGNTANAIVLASGTLQSTAATLTTNRALSGSGAIDVAAGNTLTLSGAVTTTALTVANSGTIALTGSGATQSLGSVTFNASGTIANSGSTVVVGAVTTTTGSTSVATISGPVSLTGTNVYSVADGNTSGVDLALTGVVSGTGGISKATGAGTLALTGVNTFTGTVTLGGVAVTGGTLSINNANSLGVSAVNVTTGVPTTFLNFDTGTVSNDSGTALTGNNAIVKAVSIGATTAGVGATLAGSDMEFSNSVSLFKGATGTTAQESLIVNNNTTFSGVFGLSTGAGTSTGLTVGGTGQVTLSGSAPNLFTEPVTLAGTAKLNLAKAGALGGNTGVILGSGTTVVLSGSSTVTDRINNAAAMTINGGGTLSTGGLSEGTRPSGPAATDGMVGVGALTLSGTSAAAASIIDFGSATAGSSLVFASLTGASRGAYVTVLNWGGTKASDNGTDTYDRLLFTTDPGFSNADLANFTFSGFAVGATEIAYGGEFELVPVPEPTTVLGGLLLVGAAGWSQRRRLRRAVRA